MNETIRRAIEYLKSAELAEHSNGIMAPGEDYVQFNKDHDANGIFVDDSVWAEIKALQEMLFPEAMLKDSKASGEY